VRDGSSRLLISSRIVAVSAPMRDENGMVLELSTC
jgi:hypothetical protein